MYALPTLSKARGLSLKRPVCAICIDRTRGCTQETRDAAGAPPIDPATTHACHTCTAHTPSRRTLKRWHAERRWLTQPP